jgi:Flp pilus assembly protein TadD
LDKVIEMNPNLPLPYLMLARLYLDQKQQKQALDKLNAIVALTNSVSALMEIGMIHDQLKEDDLARQFYEKVLALSPQSLPALNNLACLYSDHLNQLDKAGQLAEKAQQLYPFDPYVADTLGWILFKKGEYSRALALEQESAAKQPADPEVQFHLGMAHYMMGEDDPARVAFQAAASKSDFADRDEALQRLAIIAIDPATATPAQRDQLEKQVQKEPTDPIALMRLASLQERDGDAEKAAATYEAVIKRNPQNVRVLARLAQLYVNKLNQLQKGLDLAKNAHQQAPDDPYISAILGRLLFQTHDYPYALSLLQAAVRSMPGQPDLLHDLAWSYFSNGNEAQARASMASALQTGLPFAKQDEARQFLDMLDVCANPAQTQAAAKVQQVLRADTNYAPALMASALLQEQQAHPKEAEALYEKVLAAYPLFTRADRQLAILYARDGNDAKAYACAQLARAAFPEDAELARCSGLLSYRRKEYQISSQYLTRAAAKYPADAELLYYLGMDDYQLKDNVNCKKNLQRAVDLKLPDNLATEAKTVLAQLK